MPHAPVKPGDVIADKYLIERLLGEGGMGVVFAARHLQLEQLVAIKFLLTREPGDAATQRFRREARAAARIRSEHVCRVLDVGELDLGTPYMVMEYLEGCDLSEALEKRQRLHVAEAVGLVLQACEALAEAHAAGIVHRDIKPGNLFLAERPMGPPIVKVLDFGISKVMDPGAGLALTSTLMQIGSPLYMSPEQIDSSKDVDGRTDVWSLGVVLYELVAGRPPYMADTMPQLVHAMMNSAPPSFAELGIDVPDGFEAVVLRALTRDREARIESVIELACALAPFADSKNAGTVARIASLANSPTLVDSERAKHNSADSASVWDMGAATEAASRTAKSTATPSQWERAALGTTIPGRSRAGMFMGGLLLVGLVAGGAYLVRGTQSSSGAADADSQANGHVAPTSESHPHSSSAATQLPPAEPASIHVAPALHLPQIAVQVERPDAAIAQALEGRAAEAKRRSTSRQPPAATKPSDRGSIAATAETSHKPVLTVPRANQPAMRAPVASPATPAPAVDTLPDFGGRR